MATPCSRYFLKARWWNSFSLPMPSRDDVPAEDFFVDVGELDAAGELGEIGVLLDQRLRIEDDRRIEVLLGNLVVDGAAELGLDLRRW